MRHPPRDAAGDSPRLLVTGRKGTVMANPRAWGHYRRLVAAHDLPENPRVNRFAARYRLAGALRGVDFHGISEATTAGFERGLRLTLSYSALEALESSLPPGEQKARVVDPVLAARLRDPANRKFTELLLEDRDERSKLAGRIDAVLAGWDEDLRPVVEKARHLVAHGVFTAHGSGLATSAKRRAVVDELAAATLRAADARFTEWVATIRASPVPRGTGVTGA